MNGSRQNREQRGEEEHVPLVDVTDFLPRINVSQRPWRASFHAREQRCHAGQLVSRTARGAQITLLF